MTRDNKFSIENLLQAFRESLAGLSLSEREHARDAFLAMLLFEKEVNKGKPGQNFESLSPEERELIRKLAENTELLWRLGNADFLDQ